MLLKLYQTPLSNKCPLSNTHPYIHFVLQLIVYSSVFNSLKTSQFFLFRVPYKNNVLCSQLNLFTVVA